MEEIDDDFGDLYADVEVQASSAINGVKPDFTSSNTQQQQHSYNDNLGEKVSDESHLNKNGSELGGEERREKMTEMVNEGGNEVGVENGSESDDDDEDDFDVVVNDDDYGAKNGSGEAVKGEDDEIVVGVTEGNTTGKSRMWAENGEMEQCGSGYGGERENVGKNGCNSQYKTAKQYGSVLTANQRSISSRRYDREDFGYIQHRRPRLGRVGPSYAGYIPGLAEHGNSFSLPWYRTILDVNIDNFEQKPWTLQGADMTDYFNFGFDEQSWRSYCQSLEQMRQQTLIQSRHQAFASLRSKLDIESAAPEEVEAEVNLESIPDGHRKLTFQESECSTRQIKRQIGQAIHVEDSNTERQPSMVARPPRNLDSDVVIQITVLDPEESCSSGKEDPDDMLETKRIISDDGYNCLNDDTETAEPAHPKSCKMAKNFVEANISSPGASSDLKSSYESATASSHMLQDSGSQGKGLKSDSDTLHSGKVDTSSRGNARVVETLDASMEDADRNTEEINPCLEGIDSLFEDQLQSSSPSTSDSDIRSMASSDRDCFDLRRTQDSRKSLSDSVMEGHQDDHHVSRHSGRDVIKMKAGDGKYRSRVRSHIEEDWKHYQRKVRRHSKRNSPNDEEDNYHSGIRGRMYGRDRLRAHRSKKREHISAFDDEDWRSYREKVSSFRCYNKRSAENRVQADSMKETHPVDHWRSRDELDFNLSRECDEKELYSDRRIRRTKDEIVEREWYLHERECMVGKPRFQDQPHYISRYSSSFDIERSNRHSAYDDVHFSKRILDDRSLDYSCSDGPALDRYGRSFPLDGRENESLDPYIRERRLRYAEREVATFSHGYQYLETIDDPYLDLDYPPYIRDDDKYLNRHPSQSTHNYHDMHPAYTERRHDSIFYREDVDAPRVFQKHGGHDIYVSPQRGRDDRHQFHDHRDAYDRQDAIRYLDEDNYSGNKRNVVQSKGMDWTEDVVSYNRFNNDYVEDKLDSFKGVSKHKWHGNKHVFVAGGMSMHTKNMKHKQRIVNGSGGKPYDTSSKMPTRVKHEQTGLWCRNSVELRHVVREKKTLQSSTGKCSKAGSDWGNDDCGIADGRVQKQKKEQEVNGSATTKVMENKAPSVAALLNDTSITKRDDASDDLEEGQIPAEEACTDNLKKRKCRLPHVAQNGNVKRMSHNEEKTSQSDFRVYDENRILETMAKMEKRRERFKEPMLLKKESDSDPKPDVDPPVETAQSKQQRPARKRRWGGS